LVTKTFLAASRIFSSVVFSFLFLTISFNQLVNKYRDQFSYGQIFIKMVYSSFKTKIQLICLFTGRIELPAKNILIGG
jgi:hypothetical protein